MQSRRMHRELEGSIVTRHVYTDSSPSSGFEILATEADEFIEGERLMNNSTKLPYVGMSHGFTSLAYKTFALLWQIFLVVGPSGDDMRRWVDSVESITTDWGTESGIVNAPDVIPWFLATVLGKAPPEIDKHSRLFRKALWLPGWNHLMSNAMKAALNTLRTWPGVLQKLRVFTKFFRNVDYRMIVHTAVRKRFGKGIAKVRFSLGLV